MSRFSSTATISVDLGVCECPGQPHERDSAEVYAELAWDDLVDIGSAQSEGAARRLLVTRALASWTLIEAGPDGSLAAVPITEATVRRLGQPTLERLAGAVNAAFEAAGAALPNASGAASPRSQPAKPSSTRPIRRTPRRTRSS